MRTGPTASSPYMLSGAPAGIPLMDAYQPMLVSMAECGRAVSGGYAAIGAEWLSFINRRVQKDMALQEQFAKCRNPQDWIAQWTSFMQAASEDYQSEMSRIAELSKAASGAAFSALQNGLEKRGNGSATLL